MSSPAPRVVLAPRRAGPIRGRHPWVLATAVGRVEGAPQDGDVVDVLDAEEVWIARGVYNGRSRIRVRLYTWNPDEPLDDAFWRRRLELAIRLRRSLGYDAPADACRLVFSEGDGLSGLIVDRYGEDLVIQVTALALSVRLERIADLLGELVSPRSIWVRTDDGVARAEGMPPRDGLLRGEEHARSVEFSHLGVKYRIDFGGGQKTGFYLDQRENRAAAARYLAGRRTLDVCCYTGGFGLAARVLGGCGPLLGIDSSAKAVEQARANAELNGIADAQFEVGDCFQTLEKLARSGEKFGSVILDPPRFAGGRKDLDQALRAYHRLNKLAVQLLAPEGILVTCSCSGHVSREDFRDMLLSVAHITGRDLQVLEQRGAAPDHPVRITCLETEYLKCFVCRVA